jgi:hypothetical protein
MGWRYVVFAAVLIVQTSYALAQTHQQICVPSVINGKTASIVSKEKLAKAILNQNADAQALYINADAPRATRHISRNGAESIPILISAGTILAASARTPKQENLTILPRKEL